MSQTNCLKHVGCGSDEVDPAPTPMTGLFSCTQLRRQTLGKTKEGKKANSHAMHHFLIAARRTQRQCEASRESMSLLESYTFSETEKKSFFVGGWVPSKKTCLESPAPARQIGARGGEGVQHFQVQAGMATSLFLSCIVIVQEGLVLWALWSHILFSPQGQC